MFFSFSVEKLYKGLIYQCVIWPAIIMFVNKKDDPFSTPTDTTQILHHELYYQPVLQSFFICFVTFMYPLGLYKDYIRQAPNVLHHPAYIYSSTSIRSLFHFRISYVKGKLSCHRRAKTCTFLLCLPPSVNPRSYTALTTCRQLGPIDRSHGVA